MNPLARTIQIKMERNQSTPSIGWLTLTENSILLIKNFYEQTRAKNVLSSPKLHLNDSGKITPKICW
jgi:hypothetical protein